MNLFKAKAIANKYKAMLEPYCDRIEIAGSIRRQCKDVGDIELVAIPKIVSVQEGLFDSVPQRHPAFIKIINSLEKVKGDPTGKYTQRILPEGIKLDLFMVNKDNWGYHFAIRTGPAEFSHKVLAKGWTAKGYHGRDGILHDECGKPTPIKEEKDLFKLIDIYYIEPEKREFAI